MLFHPIFIEFIQRSHSDIRSTSPQPPPHYDDYGPPRYNPPAPHPPPATPPRAPPSPPPPSGGGKLTAADISKGLGLSDDED